MVKCPICGSQASNRPALKNHVYAAHPRSAARIYSAPRTAAASSRPNNQGAVQQRRSRRRARGGYARVAGMGGAVPNPSSVVPYGGADVRTTGTDRLGSYTVSSTTNNAIVRVQFSPDDLPRLRLLSGAFQRVVYHNLRFEIATKASAYTGGGYVAGFVADPDDPVESLDRLLCTQGARNMKWWESVSIPARPSREWYYTSQHGQAEARFYSPGTFVVWVDGMPTSTVSFTVNVHWDCSFMIPSIEVDKEPPIIRVTKYLRIKSGKIWFEGASDPRASNTTAWYEDAKLSFDHVPTSNTFYRMSSAATVEYKEGSGDTGTLPYRYILFWYDNDGKVRANARPNPYDQDWLEGGTAVSWQSDVDPVVVLVPGDVLEYVGVVGRRFVNSSFRNPRRLLSRMPSGGNYAAISEPPSRCSSPSMNDWLVSSPAFENNSKIKPQSVDLSKLLEICRSLESMMSNLCQKVDAPITPISRDNAAQ